MDAHVHGTVKVRDNNVIAFSEGVKREFRVLDGPIRHGYKHRTDVNVDQHVRGLLNILKPGGGGYNTAASIKRRADIASNLELHYLDVSVSDPILQESLDTLGIESHFFGLRLIPTNAVFGGREDKIILKGPPLSRVDLRRKDNRTIDYVVGGSQGVVINSAKDESFVESLIRRAVKRDIPLYFCITPSLGREFVFNYMLPRGVTIISHEDITSLHSENPLTKTDKELFDMALEYARRIKLDKVNKGNYLFVTLGSNGVLCSNHERYLYHVRLKEKYADSVDCSASSKLGSTNGAGDTFTGAVVAVKSSNPNRSGDVKRLAMRASKAAIRFIGYDGPIGYDSFMVRTYK